MTTRILIADDQALVRGGLRMILDAQQDLEVVGKAVDGREALEKARELLPDLVLMDVRMPQLDGLETTRRLLGQVPSPKVLILTTFDLDDYVYEAIRAGASGFLLKSAPRSSSSPASTRSWPATHCSPPRLPAACSTTSPCARPALQASP